MKKFRENDRQKRGKELQDFVQFLRQEYLEKQQKIPGFQRKMFQEISGMEPEDWLGQLDEGKKPVSIPWWIKK